MDKMLQKLMEALAEGRDAQEVWRELGISAEKAADAMASPAGRKQMAARRVVGRRQTELQARRHAAAAVRKLRELMEGEKGELQLKAAMALLNMTQEKQRKGSRPRRPAKKPRVNEAEVKEWLLAISRVLLERRQAQAMGPPPKKEVK